MNISEKEFKKILIDHLNLINKGWVDGDRENTKGKRADIVNRLIKMAIEIKDDTCYDSEIPSSGKNIDLEEMNERFTDDLKSANNKFKEYPDYKTVLLIRTEFPVADIICDSIGGVRFCNKNLEYVGRKTKYSEYIRKETGCFLISNKYNYCYCPNEFANEDRIVKKEEMEKILGLELKNLDKWFIKT